MGNGDGSDELEVRLDKWLQVARMYKTRSQATTACNQGKVKVDGQEAKAHRRVNVGDRIEVDKDDWPRVIEVKELRDKPVPKKMAPQLYEDHTPPRPELDPLEQLLRQAPVHRDRGAGRPTKKQRRDMDKFRGD